MIFNAFDQNVWTYELFLFPFHFFFPPLGFTLYFLNILLQKLDRVFDSKINQFYKIERRGESQHLSHE